MAAPPSPDLYLTDLSPKDKPWDDNRAYASKVEGLYSIAGEQRYAERINDCSRLLDFLLTQVEDGFESAFKLQNARFCRVRHCPVCQWRRSLMWRARFFNAVPKISQDYPKARWIFLTLTVKNCPVTELRATLQDMNRAWRRLIELKRFPALGFVKSVEVTRSKDGTAHPHFHVLLLVRSSYFKGQTYVSQATWRDLWQKCLRVDYLPVVHVRSVKGKQGDDPIKAIHAGLLETLKYTVKPQDLVGSLSPECQTENAAWLSELTAQLHKTRAISVGGCLKNYLSEEEPEDLIHEEGEEIEESSDGHLIRFGWRENVKRYVKTDR